MVVEATCSNAIRVKITLHPFFLTLLECGMYIFKKELKLNCKLTKIATFSAVKAHTESTGAYTGIFPEKFILFKI